VPEVNDGPAGTVTDKVETPTEATPLPGFAEAMTDFGSRVPGLGEPEKATAVETSATEVAPPAEAEKPEAPAKDEAKPDEAKTVNFDGLSKESKAYWEKSLKAGHATPEDVERARIESMFQSSWTRNHQALAKERDAFKAEKAQLKEDIDLLNKIRGDDRLHAAWLKMSKGEVAAEDAESGDLVDEKKAAEIARKAFDAREAEKADRTAKEQAKYEARKSEIQAAVHDQMRILGVTKEVMTGYLQAEEEALNGADPILHFTPTELQAAVQRRHEKASLEAKVAALEAQLNQRASKTAQASKSSLPPARRFAEDVSKDPLKQTESDLGIAPDWSNVQGFGNRNGMH
jgi:hypothetical protein